MVLPNYSERPALYGSGQRLLFMQAAWDDAWNIHVLLSTLWDSSSLLNFLEFKKRLLTKAVQSPSLEVPKTWLVTPWATRSELTVEPAWSNVLDWKPAKGLSTCVGLGILTKRCDSGLFWENGKTAGSSMWLFTAAALSASGREKMSCFKHLTGSCFSTLGDFYVITFFL